MILMLTALALMGSDPVQSLTLRFEGLRSGEGDVLVGVYDSSAALARRQPVRRARVSAASPNPAVTFEALPPGRYAAIAFHDRNGNGRLDTGPFGLPAEPVATSASGRVFGPPRWTDIAFELGSTSLSRTLRMR